MKNEILDKVDEIIKTIENTPDYQRYLEIKEKMGKNKKLNSLINEVRVLQRDVVHHMDKKKLLDEKMQELMEYPLYVEYQNALYEVNNYYAIVETSINNYFDSIFN